MTEFRVRYEIDVTAASPEEAALIVAEIMRDRDPASLSPVLEIDGVHYDTEEMSASA